MDIEGPSTEPLANLSSERRGRMCYLIVLNLHLILLVSSAGFVLAGNNQVGAVLAIKNDWGTKTDLNNTIISSVGITGLILGSLLSSKFVGMGRRKYAMINCLIIMISVLPTIIFPDLWVICIGRFIFGFAAGANITCASMMQGETVPKANASLFAATINLGIITGIMVCLFTGLPILDLSDAEAIATWLWMIVYGFPIATSFISILLFLFVFKEEPIDYLISKGDAMEEAKIMITKVYGHYVDSDRIYEELRLIDFEKKSA
jgi:MFS family permease